MKASALIFASVACAGIAHGATKFPDRSVRVVVSAPSESEVDVLSRIVAANLMEQWGKPVIVDNRETVAGADVVAKAAPDGHTLLIVSSDYAVRPFLMQSLPYRTPKDFVAAAVVATSPNVILVHPSVQAKSVRELVDVARSRPMRVSFGSAGIGSPGHLAMELFRRVADVTIVHVPYRGVEALNAAAMAGRVHLHHAPLRAALPFVQSAKLRALAVTGMARAYAAPDIPTVAESGVPGYMADEWFAALAPARTQRRVIEGLNKSVQTAVAAADAKLKSAGLDGVRMSPRQANRFVEGEIVKWGNLIQQSGIRGE